MSWWDTLWPDRHVTQRKAIDEASQAIAKAVKEHGTAVCQRREAAEQLRLAASALDIVIKGRLNGNDNGHS